MKVYKYTFWVSIIVSFVLLGASFLLNTIQINEKNEKWVALAINICVGISCSAIVVIVTTKIQHLLELKKQTEKVIDDLFLFGHIYQSAKETIFNKGNEINDKDKKECADFLSKKCREILDCLEEIAFLWKNKYKQLILHMRAIWFILNGINKSKFDEVFMRENMQKAFEEIALFTESEFYRKQFEEWSKGSE